MRDFGDQIRNMVSSSRSGLEQVGSLLNSTPAQVTLSSMAPLAFSAQRKGESAIPTEESKEGAGEFHIPAPAPFAATIRHPEPSYTPAQISLPQAAAKPVVWARAGTLTGSWGNRCEAAAMPALLIVERFRYQHGVDSLALRAQLVRELQHFRQQLLRQQFLPEDVRSMSYLLCTYIDWNFSEMREQRGAPLNLLIEFHRDSWGGEACFTDLERYMGNPHEYREILELYHLILSMGFKGKYHVLERGEVLLADLMQRLDAMVYERGVTETLNDVKPVATTLRRRRLTPSRLLVVGTLMCLMGWGGVSFYLHDKSRVIRHAIMAWEPPVPRKINIMETLPQPLPTILSEGWLEVREDPRGWLLLFTSDGAFRTGKSVLSPEFVKKRNIERLGEALAGWPGDLEVIGHTDAQPFRNSKAKDPNQELSQARAQAVADRIQEGMLANSKYKRNITAVGKGDSEPLADNTTEEGRRKNRRVDILWKVGDRAENKATPEAQNSQGMPALLNKGHSGSSR